MPLASLKTMSEVTTSESSASESDEPESSSESSSSDNDSDDECEEIGLNSDDQQPNPTCIFCDRQLPFNELFQHLNTDHSLDVFELRRRFNMDQESYVKFVNFLRTETKNASGSSSSSNEIKSIADRVMKSTTPLWDNNEFLKPVVEEDPLLTYWFECDDNDDEEEEEKGATKGNSTSKQNESSSNVIKEGVIVGENSSVSTSSSSSNNNGNISESNKVTSGGNIQQFEEALSEAFEKIQIMQQVMSRICLDNENISTKQILKSHGRTNQFDSDYFASYDDVGIHNTMLSDVARTEAYQDAILKNETDFKNKIVLDVGCGTGILSMFCAKAGASKVFAVDRSKILEKAKLIVRENGFENIIECVRGTVESIQLPVPQVDFIISEFMGYFLLYEGMLSSVIEARKKFLKPGGSLYPNTSEIFIQGISDMVKYQESLTMWDNVYGFKMSCFKEGQFSQPSIETVKEEKCVTEPVSVLTLNLMTCENNDFIFEKTFNFKVTRTCQMTGICGYFDVGFSHGSNFTNVLSTAPTLPSTHWYQTVFYFKKPISIQEGDEVKSVFKCRPNSRNPRWLDFDVSVAGDSYSYTMK